ncbi:hypothetical protein DVH24_009400 [Malus domestica]|uniref:Uncharacterized protein n=1 Tax=Malus domestica TaxID=3750 RepID=A0A498IQU9_MALDO|nr:hypothetical protein DVH24_009400 [Malus domestica]
MAMIINPFQDHIVEEISFVDWNSLGLYSKHDANGDASDLQGMDDGKVLLMSQMNFEKNFRQSTIFVTSTWMEQGDVPPSSSPAMMLKEATHVISCGYEDKTEWGLKIESARSSQRSRKTKWNLRTSFLREWENDAGAKA